MKTRTTAPVESKMARKKRSTETTLFIALISLIAFAAFVPVFAPIPSLSPQRHRNEESGKRSFEIEDDKFWKDGEPFRIIGGDLHYFRVVPEVVKGKGIGIKHDPDIIPWNLHELSPGRLVFEGIADLVAFVKLCHIIMLRPGPYICAEWDLGGFPAWLLAVKPPLRLRSSDPAYLELIENEFGSFGDDKAYLHHLV